MTKEFIPHDEKFEPVGLSAYDTIRQRFTAFVVEETDTEYRIGSLYFGGELSVLPKYAWRIVADAAEV
jgi:hypothetical protein